MRRATYVCALVWWHIRPRPELFSPSDPKDAAYTNERDFGKFEFKVLVPASHLGPSPTLAS